MATTDVTAALLGSGAVCHGGGLSLLHNTTYYSTLYITNGAITNYTTTLYTNGIPIYFPSNYYILSTCVRATTVKLKYWTAVHLNA